MDVHREGSQMSVKNLNLGFSFELGGTSLKEPSAMSAINRLSTLADRDSFETSDIPTADFSRAAKEVELSMIDQQHRHAALTPRLVTPRGSGHRSDAGSGPRSDAGVAASLKYGGSTTSLPAGVGAKSLDVSSREDPASMQDLDAFESIVEFSRAHESLLSWYYMDDDNKVRVNEIYGLSEAEQQQLELAMESRAHSRNSSRQVSRRPSFSSLKSLHSGDADSKK